MVIKMYFTLNTANDSFMLYSCYLMVEVLKSSLNAVPSIVHRVDLFTAVQTPYQIAHLASLLLQAH